MESWESNIKSLDVIEEMLKLKPPKPKEIGRINLTLLEEALRKDDWTWSSIDFILRAVRKAEEANGK